MNSPYENIHSTHSCIVTTHPNRPPPLYHNNTTTTTTIASSTLRGGGGAGAGGGREPSSLEEDQEQAYPHSASPVTGADSEIAPGGHINDRKATGGSSSGPGLGPGSGSGWGRGLGIAFGQRRTYLETHEGGDVYTVAFHPEGRYLASGGADGTVAVHDVVAATCIKQFTGHNISCRDLIKTTY